MALVYKKSTDKDARRYERSPGMEPNPGVSALTVVNKRRAKKRRVSQNPFQWIEGRGQRHRHASKSYDTLRSAIGWKKRHPRSDARLYPVDERGTVVSRPVSKKLLSNKSRRSGMAYNIGALRRAMRSNPRRSSTESLLRAAKKTYTGGGRRSRRGPVTEIVTEEGVIVESGGKRRRKRKTSKRRKTGRKAAARKRTRRRTSKRRASKRRKTRRKAAARRRSTRRRGTRRRRSTKTARSRSRAAKLGWARRRRGTAKRRSTKTSRSRSMAARAGAAKRRRRASRRTSRRRKSRRRKTRRAAARRTGRRRTSRGRRRRARASRRGGRRRSKYYYGRRRVRLTGKEYVDKYLSRGYMPAVARVRRSSKSKSGRPDILSYPVGRGRGRLSKRRTTRRGRARRSYAIGATHRGTRARRMAANRRSRRRRSTRRNSRRRRTRRNSRRRRTALPPLYRVNSRRRRSRRSSRRRRSRRNPRYVVRNRRSRRRRSRRRRSRPRRSSRRRGTRRRRSRRRLSRNMLAASKVKWGGRGSRRMGRARGRLYQLVEFGPRSKGRPSKKGRRRRMSGYPVVIPAHVSAHGYVRKYRFGGAAKDAHARARRSGYSKRRWPRVRKNSRRRSMRRNPRYVVANARRRRRKTRRNRGRRRMRRNQFFGADLMKDIVTPVAGGTAGFVAARVLSNSVANIGGIRNILDSGRSAADAENTKIATNIVGILATLGLARRVAIIRRNQGAIITGMGLALTDRLLGKMGGAMGGYLGEYVSQPLGEYVSQPLGAYVQDPSHGVGEYVSQPLGADLMYATAGMGETLYAAAGVGDPANQEHVDRTMDIMEAAAGTPSAYQAAAGMGQTLYAAAGLGAEADVGLERMYAREQPPWASIQTPTDVALPVTRDMPYARPIPSGLVTPEGRGYAGGLFARHLFAGMF